MTTPPLFPSSHLSIKPAGVVLLGFVFLLCGCTTPLTTQEPEVIVPVTTPMAQPLQLPQNWQKQLPETIVFEGYTLKKAYQNKMLTEYILPQDTLEQWHVMVALRNHGNNREPLGIMAHKAGVLSEKLTGEPFGFATEPVANTPVPTPGNTPAFTQYLTKTPKAALSFVLSDTTTTERNYFRYEKDDAGNVVSFQVALRTPVQPENTQNSPQPNLTWSLDKMFAYPFTVLFFPQ